MSKNDKDQLLDSLDQAAVDLLKNAQIGVSLSSDPPPAEKPTLAEQVKVFEAVMDWAKQRRDLRPQEKKESKFDAVRKQFSGDAGKSRRSSRAAPETASGGTADDPDFDGSPAALHS